MFSKLPTHTKVCSESAPKQIITRKGCGPHLVVCDAPRSPPTPHPPPPPHRPDSEKKQRKECPPPPLPLCQHHTGSSGRSRSRSRSQESAVMTVQPPTTGRTRVGQCDVWGRRLNSSCGCWLRFGAGRVALAGANPDSHRALLCAEPCFLLKCPLPHTQ